MKTLNGAAEPEPRPEIGGHQFTWTAPGTTGTAWWGWCTACGLHFNNHLVGCSNLRVLVWHNNTTMPIRSWSFPNSTITLT